METPDIWPYVSWNIRNICNLNSLYSEEIFVKGYIFYLELSKKICINAKNDCLEMYLVYSEIEPTDACSFMVSTYLKDASGENHFVQKSRIVGTESQHMKLIWKVALLDLFENCRLDWKTSLHFVCMFGPESEYQTGVEGYASGSSKLCSHKDHLEKLSLEISRMFIHDASGDVLLKCEENEILAHRNILSARSPVFKELFKNEIVQKSPKKVTISGVSYCSLKKLLTFLYSGSVVFHHESTDSAMQLYEAARKYEVSGLQKECMKFLVDNVKEETACRLLLFASANKDDTFLMSVSSFIIKMEILKSKSWIEFSYEHPELALGTYFLYLEKYLSTVSNLEYMHKLP